jgi:hypothetical protein
MTPFFGWSLRDFRYSVLPLSPLAGELRGRLEITGLCSRFLVPAEHTSKRQLLPGFLLVFALALLGLHADVSKTQTSGSSSVVFQQAHGQALALRTTEAKPSTRKVQPFAPYLISPASSLSDCGLCFTSVRTLRAEVLVGGTISFGNIRGRAPPRLIQA